MAADVPVLRVIASLLVASLLMGACSLLGGDDDGGNDGGNDGGAVRVGSSGTGGGDDDGVEGLAWQERDGLEYATLAVPLDHGDPTGPTIDMALVRAPATGPGERIGSLVMNPGGPGGSGLVFLEETLGFEPDYLADVRERFDLVSFDPRGVGASTAVLCGDSEQIDAAVSLDPVPDDEGEYAALEDANAAWATACDENSGELLSHVSTEAAAADMEILREALGDESLSYVGYSYGTLLGATYAEQYPDRVRAMVLDGALPRSLTDEEVLVGQAEGFEDALNDFFAWCRDDAQAKECALREGGDPSDAYDELFSRLDREPIPAPDADGDRDLTSGYAYFGVINGLYAPEVSDILALAIDRALDGDGSLLVSLADLYNGREDGEYDNTLAANTAINCVDVGAVSDETISRLRTMVPETAPRLGPLLVEGPDLCAGWPVLPTGQTGPVVAAGSPPIVVVSTTEDPATPYEWGVRMAQELASGVLVTHEGTGHTAYGQNRSGCIDAAVDAYLLDLEVPAGRHDLLTRCVKGEIAAGRS